MSIIGIISNTVLFIVAILVNIGWRKEIKHNERLLHDKKDLLFERDMLSHEIAGLTEKLEKISTPSDCNKGEWCEKCNHSYIMPVQKISASGQMYTVPDYGCDHVSPCKGFERGGV